MASQATPNNPLALRRRIDPNTLFCIIAGTSAGLCWMHRPSTPQLTRPFCPGLRPGVAEKKRDTVVGLALFFGSGQAAERRTKHVIWFNSPPAASAGLGPLNSDALLSNLIS